MKKIALFVIIITLLMINIAYAAGEPPAGLTGSITVVYQDATNVTVLAEQTGGSLVTLSLESWCYAGNVFAGGERVRFVEYITTTFDIGPRIYKGQYLVPTDCSIQIWYYFSSRRGVILAEIDITP